MTKYFQMACIFAAMFWYQFVEWMDSLLAPAEPLQNGWRSFAAWVDSWVAPKKDE